MSSQHILKIKTEYDRDYKIVPASGIFGGLTPRGELRVDFFTEYSPNPPEIQVTVSEQGQVVNETPTKPDFDFVRRMLVGIIIPAQQVESFANWFAQKAREISILSKQGGGHDVSNRPH